MALARGDVLEAVRISEKTSRFTTDLARAQILDQRGEADAALLDFNAAFDAWETAAVCYDRAKSPVGATRCALLAARLTALNCGNIPDAAAMINSAQNLRGYADTEIFVEFALLRVYTLYRQVQRTEALAALDTLRLDQSSWSPWIRARVAVFGIVFGFDTAEDDLFASLDDIAAIEPPSARIRLLDWCEFSEASIDLPRNIRSGFEELFELDRNSPEAPSTPAARPRSPASPDGRAGSCRG